MWHSSGAIILVLLLERFLPEQGDFDPLAWLADWIDSVELRFNGGEGGQGTAAYALVAGATFLVVLLLQTLLLEIGTVMRFGFDVLLLWMFVRLVRPLQVTAVVRQAIEDDDQSLVESSLDKLPQSSIELGGETNNTWLAVSRLLTAANKHGISPIFWYLLLGPAGTVLQYVSAQTARRWDWRRSRFQQFGRTAYAANQILSWLPTRILALGYALMGNFEDAIGNWRRNHDVWTGDGDELLLAVGTGALGLESDPDNADRSAVFPVDVSLIDRSRALVMRAFIFWFATGCILAIYSMAART